MYTKLKSLALYIIAIFVLINIPISCNSDDDTNQSCVSYKKEYITSVESPSAGSVNQTMEIPIKFLVYNGCGGFHQFLETTDGFTKTIEVEAKYDGCICTLDTSVIATTYTFLPSKAGDYTLEFKSGINDYIKVHIHVQ